MEHRGTLITFILFLIPGFPKDALSYIIGLSHMKTSIFLLLHLRTAPGHDHALYGGNCARNGQNVAVVALLESAP